jgi:SAM-dependent methyltransferase
MLNKKLTPFERSGLASISEITSPVGKLLLAKLELVSKEFLEQEAQFRSPEYFWPRDPLHEWSRRWEYPYVYHHLQRWLAGGGPAGQPTVVDLGSGVTFFPFACARLGATVICADVDPICARDIPRAAEVVSAGPGSVQYRGIERARLPFEDHEVDALYCISVLEHVPGRSGLVSEIARVIKPGGLLVLTLDIDREGHGEMTPQDYCDLTKVLDRYFMLGKPLAVVSGPDLLTSLGSTIKLYGSLRPGWICLKERVVKPLLGRSPASINLCVMGLVMTRRADWVTDSEAPDKARTLKNRELLLRLESEFPIL